MQIYILLKIFYSLLPVGTPNLIMNATVHENEMNYIEYHQH